jgi:hypothetical protein
MNIDGFINDSFLDSNNNYFTKIFDRMIKKFVFVIIKYTYFYNLLEENRLLSNTK